MTKVRVSAVFFGAVLALPFFVGAQTTALCNQFPSGSTPPAGYAASWNVLTAAREMLVFATCTQDAATFTVGSGASNQYIYKVSYGYSQSGSSANQWIASTLTGTLAQGSADWMIGKATLASNRPIVSNPYYWVGYVCQWQSTSESWKCGCRDSACAQPFWQLQASSNPYASGGTTGGIGGGGGTSTGSEIALCYASTGNIKNVSNSSQFSSALSTAQPGDHIVVAPGSYSGDFSLSRSGTASNPIVIKGANPSNRPKMTGRINLSGNYGVVEGFEFTGNGGVTVTGDHNRVTRNYSHHYTATVFLVRGSGSNNRIDHNEIAYLTASGAGKYGIRIEIYLANAKSGRWAKDNRIDHNYLHDLTYYAGGNGREPILSGNFSNVSHGTLIDHNLLLRAGSDEIIGIKGSDIRIIGNTIIDAGQLYANNRLGARNLWKNNWFENADLRVYAKGNKLIGNNLSQGGAIHLLRGSILNDQFEREYWEYDTREPSEWEPVAEDTLLAGNIGGTIFLGAKYSGPLAVRNTRLEANSSTISRAFHTGTSESATTNIDVGTARKLTTSDVGLSAPDSSCQ